MELNTYLGKAGTGKSYHMIKNIKQQMKKILLEILSF